MAPNEPSPTDVMARLEALNDTLLRMVPLAQENAKDQRSDSETLARIVREHREDSERLARVVRYVEGENGGKHHRGLMDRVTALEKARADDTAAVQRVIQEVEERLTIAFTTGLADLRKASASPKASDPKTVWAFLSGIPFGYLLMATIIAALLYALLTVLGMETPHFNAIGGG